MNKFLLGLLLGVVLISSAGTPPVEKDLPIVEMGSWTEGTHIFLPDNKEITVGPGSFWISCPRITEDIGGKTFELYYRGTDIDSSDYCFGLFKDGFE